MFFHHIGGGGGQVHMGCGCGGDSDNGNHGGHNSGKNNHHTITFFFKEK